MPEIDEHDLLEIARLAHETAVLQARYLRRGFSVEDIATTFTRIFYHEFRKELDSKILNLIAKDIHPEMRAKCMVEIAEAMGNIFLRFSSAYIQVEMDEMRKDEAKKEKIQAKAELLACRTHNQQNGN